MSSSLGDSLFCEEEKGPFNLKVTHPSQKLARRLRFLSPPSYSTLTSKIVSLWGAASVLSPASSSSSSTAAVLHLSYLDHEGDRILLSSDEELQVLYDEWKVNKRRVGGEGEEEERAIKMTVVVVVDQKKEEVQVDNVDEATELSIKNNNNNNDNNNQSTAASSTSVDSTPPPPSLLADLTNAFIQFTTSPAFTTILDRVAQGAYSNVVVADEPADVQLVAARNEERVGYHYGDPDPDPEPVSFEERRINETTTTTRRRGRRQVASLAYWDGEEGELGGGGGGSIVGGAGEGGPVVGVRRVERGGGAFARFSNGGGGGGGATTGQEHLPPHQQSSVCRPPSTSYLGMPGQDHIPLHQQSSGPPLPQFGQQQQESSSSSTTPSATQEGSFGWVESPNAPLVDVVSDSDSETDSDGPPPLVGVLPAKSSAAAPAGPSRTSSLKKTVLATDSDSSTDALPPLVSSNRNTDPRYKGTKKIQPTLSSTATTIYPPPPTALDTPPFPPPPPRAGNAINGGGNRFSPPPPPGPPPLYAGFPSFSAGPQTYNYNPPKGTYPVTDPNTIYSPTGVYTNMPDYQYPTFPPSDVLYPFHNNSTTQRPSSSSTPNSNTLPPTHPFTSPARTATYVFRSLSEGGPRTWIPCVNDDDNGNLTSSSPRRPVEDRVQPTTSTLYRTFGDSRSSARSEVARAREEARYGRCAGKLREMGFEEVKFGGALRDGLAVRGMGNGREKKEEEVVEEVVRELVAVRSMEGEGEERG